MNTIDVRFYKVGAIDNGVSYMSLGGCIDDIVTIVDEFQIIDITMMKGKILVFVELLQHVQIGRIGHFVNTLDEPTLIQTKLGDMHPNETKTASNVDNFHLVVLNMLINFVVFDGGVHHQTIPRNITCRN